MLIYCILQEISSQKQKRGFSFAYTPTINMVGLAAHPWAVRKY